MSSAFMKFETPVGKGNYKCSFIHSLAAACVCV